MRDSVRLEAGSVFGLWTVLGPDPCGREKYWLCRCDCGVEKCVYVYNLTGRKSNSCGHAIGRGQHEDPAPGAKYGMLTVVGPAGHNEHGAKITHCVCDCGGERFPRTDELWRGGATSCGCQRKARGRHAGYLNRKHGGCYDSRTSEFRYSKRRMPEYISWFNMKERCRNPNNKSYSNYGGRGITYDPSWEDFSVFLSDLGRRPSPKHSLDRVDVNGNYEPGNVRWATTTEQSYNRRNSRTVTHCGITKSIGEWAHLLGKDIVHIKANLARGLTPYEAVFLGYPRTKARRLKLNWDGCSGNQFDSSSADVA